ncbi:DNA polymerase [Microbulbifer sp. 2201CG32-9]|uniref:DNA polymerase n=1 Tax=Microbulbifer sp. 2201CG32-9 TaxID=3232309 RepID=UPI00345C2D3C
MLVFDIESDGLLDTITKLHCINAVDRATGRKYRFTDHAFYQDLDGSYTDVPTPRDGTLADAFKLLSSAECVAGHNIIGYDLPAVEAVYPGEVQWPQTQYDSKIASMLNFPDLKDRDFRAMRKGKLPDKGFRVGSHSLWEWGVRLGGEAKSDFKPGQFIDPRTGRKHTWATIPFTREMDDYCMQDVVANLALIEYLEGKTFSEQAIWLEMEVAKYITWQERVGIRIDRPGLEALVKELTKRNIELYDQCTQAFKPFYVRNGAKTAIPKKTIRYKDRLRADLTQGAPYSRIKLVDFNPGSRVHIARNLQDKYGWAPTEFTATGQVKIDEEVLGSLPFEEARLITEYMTVQKRLSQIATGGKAWLKKEKGGRIYGRVNQLGAVTGRMTHSDPNLAQVPANHAMYGEPCRAAFIADEGRVIVGCDADALELRVLAHFMARFDNGAYVEVVLNGKKEDGTDMHTRNQKAVGLIKRDTAKTHFYGMLYGSGDFNLGCIVLSEWPEDKLLRFYAKFPSGKKRDQKITAIGRRSRAALMEGLPALAKLTGKVKESAKRGYLKGLDGRKIPVRSMHAALNSLCQSAGAIIMKKALVLMFEAFKREGLDVVPLLNVHDEVQLSVLKEEADGVGRIAADSIRLAGEHFHFRCPLAGDYDIGTSWKETH